MNYRLGLDIGITSVGWAVLAHNSDEDPFQIVDLGVRIFDRAEHPKDGSSLALPRREARSARRRIRRHSHRLERIKLLMEEIKLISVNELTSLYHDNYESPDVYALRTEGLDRLLTREEWARVLIHLAQRRGFKSNRKSDSKDKEAGKLLAAVKENHDLLEQKSYRTVGEMLYMDEKFSSHKRNKEADYSHTIGREQVLNEIAVLFEAQRKYKNPSAAIEFENQYTKTVSSQRSFDEGPGQPSPYAGNLIERMVGKCTFEKELPRAAKACYSFELFNLYQKVNHLQVIDVNQQSRCLNNDERQSIVSLAHDKADLKYSDLRKVLQLSSDQKFNDVRYDQSGIDDTEKKTKFNYLKSYHEIRKSLDKVNKGRIKQLTHDQLNLIGEALTLYKNEATIAEKLIAGGLTKYDVDELLPLSFRGFGHLSLTAIGNILPHLEKGHVYSEAATLAGYNFRGHDNQDKLVYLPANNDQLADITNPVVRRAISQSIKVINAVIRKYGSPQLICIEMTREMGKNFSDRKKIEKQMKENADLNDAIKNKIIEYGHPNPTGQDIVKMKLWQEQDGRCAYSGDTIPVSQLFDLGIADVDHIIPFSISFNDSYANKVLVKSNENRQKGNLLPLEYMKNSPDKLERFEVWVNTSIKNQRKKQHLLKQAITEEDRIKWKDRQLNDTKYISRFMLNYIRDYLQFAPAENLGKRRVIAVNGSITSYMRKRWGLKKDRLAGDLHHAMDAAVVACISENMIQQITRYSQYQEARFSKNQLFDYGTGEVINTRHEHFGTKLVEPWENFHLELEARLSTDPAAKISAYNFKSYLNPQNIETIFVSRMPRHKNRGSAHKETVRSARLEEQGQTVSKVPITKLKLDKNGEIDSYYNPNSDKKLYEALKTQLQKYDGNGETAFKEPFYKPAAPGKPASQVKKVKIFDKSNLNVSVGNGIAANGDMLRIDVFKRSDGYFWVPIYVSDTVKPTLPNKAATHSKPYELWPEMQEEDFVFSLYPNDLVRFVHKNGVDATCWDNTKTTLKDAYVYYIKAGISNASISVESHDSSYAIPSLGVKSLVILEKWNVDVLGKRNLVKKETRQYFPVQTKRGENHRLS
ncbi:MAG: type II CRISPR RNA-guided endonuclease Cas9 [Bacillota bacterium]|nr:type II CRISPR RNA-guided endonuclease Cas9 [Bacillota bacterium]